MSIANWSNYSPSGNKGINLNVRKDQERNRKNNKNSDRYVCI